MYFLTGSAWWLLYFVQRGLIISVLESITKIKHSDWCRREAEWNLTDQSKANVAHHIKDALSQNHTHTLKKTRMQLMNNIELAVTMFVASVVVVSGIVAFIILYKSALHHQGHPI